MVIITFEESLPPALHYSTLPPQESVLSVPLGALQTDWYFRQAYIHSVRLVPSVW